VGVEWASCRNRGMSRAKALQVAKSVRRSLRFSAFLGVRPKFIFGHLIGRVCTTQPVSSCRGAQLMGMRAAWPVQRKKRLWLAPQTHEPRDEPVCGALSLLQKPLHYREFSSIGARDKLKML
jgi:hypothetical protein